MAIKKYNTVNGQWEMITPTKEEHDSHVVKFASNTELGHVKVDNTTIAINADGVISVIGGNANVADATTIIKGVVQLSSELDLDSEELAATPKAVKDAIAQMQTFTQAEIANLIGSAPETLDTISELAQALVDLDDLSEGLVTSIAEKASQVDLSTHTDNVDIHVTPEEKAVWNSAKLHVGEEAPTDTSFIWLSVE